MSKQKRNFIIYFFLGLIVILVIVWTAVFSSGLTAGEGELEVTFFDVGQGDAIFIETPGGRQILIDGGPDAAVLKKLAAEMPFYDRSIDIVVATHPDADHITGLVEVLGNYDVELVIYSGDRKDTDVFGAFYDAMEVEGRYMMAMRGDHIRIGEEIVLSVLSPGALLHSKSNNNSVVVRMDYKQDSFLFTGDIERLVEYELVRSGQDLDVDIMQAPHHGSKTSSTILFFEKVSPEIAVISVGKDNRYGHPVQSVLENLENYGIEVLRTDIEGDIRFFSDGTSL